MGPCSKALTGEEAEATKPSTPSWLHRFNNPRRTRRPEGKRVILRWGLAGKCREAQLLGPPSNVERGSSCARHFHPSGRLG